MANGFRFKQWLTLSLLSLGMVLTGLATAKEAEFSWPAHPVSPVFKSLVRVINANEHKAMEAFLKQFAKAEQADAFAQHWRSIYAEYGALEPFYLDQTWTAKQRLAIWFKGQTTQSWVMLLLSMDQGANIITGKGALRGQRPPIAVPPYSPQSKEQLRTHLQEHLNSLAAHGLFSGSIRVASGNRVLLERAIGYANKQQKTLNQVSTVFNSASVTKLLTAVAIGQLIDRGKLSLEQTLAAWVPQYPRDIAQQVTIKHLLSHTSGIELDDYPPFNRDIQNATSLAQVVDAHVRHIEHMNNGRREGFRPLNTFDYSNENYHLLGAIIEAASGMHYLDYVIEHILTPSDMADALEHYRGGGNAAIGYTQRDANYALVPGLAQPNTAFVPSSVLPSCCLMVSVRDLHQLYLSLNSRGLLTVKTLDLLQTEPSIEFDDGHVVQAYGLGVSIEKIGSASAWGHSGAMQGAGAQSWYYPEPDLYVMVLTNTDAIAAQHVVGFIRDQIAPLP